MIPVMGYIFLGALAFSGQDVEGLSVGTVRPFTGMAVTNFRHTDLDGDGAPDLVLPGRVHFQRDGGFPPESRVPMPPFARMPEVDLWDGMLYCRLPGRLTVYAWRDGGWAAVLDQAMEWPGLTGPPGPNPSAVRLARFLCDAEDDGAPEILEPAPEGLFLYRREDDAYVQAFAWDILPELTLAPAMSQTLWPPEERRISLPVRQMWCRILCHDGIVAVLTEQESEAKRVVHVRREYALTDSGTLRDTPPPAGVSRSRPLPDHLQVCRLNTDDTMDYAGGKWDVSEASAYPALIYETWASVDGGASFAVRRVPSFQGFRPHCSFVDFDGDGDMDIVTESAALLTVGMREMVSEVLARPAIDHEVCVYTQAQGAFSSAPAVRFRRTVKLKQPPSRGGPHFKQYHSADRVSIVGDFNADGYRDLAVQAEIDRIDIHLASGYGYNARPDTVLAVPEGTRFGVADVNADGRSDIVVHPRHTAGPEAGMSTVYFAGEAVR